MIVIETETRCRKHGYVISNGLFDAPCPQCEYEMEYGTPANGEEGEGQ